MSEETSKNEYAKAASEEILVKALRLIGVQEETAKGLVKAASEEVNNRKAEKGKAFSTGDWLLNNAKDSKPEEHGKPAKDEVSQLALQAQPIKAFNDQAGRKMECFALYNEEANLWIRVETLRSPTGELIGSRAVQHKEKFWKAALETDRLMKISVIEKHIEKAKYHETDDIEDEH